MRELVEAGPRRTVAARMTAFLAVLLVALTIGAAAGQWAGPVDDAGYGSSADPHAGH